MKKANVIVLAGQSNAVGVGFTKYLPEHFDQETIDLFYRGFDNVLIRFVSHDIKSDGFGKVRVNCTEASKDTLGPEVGIAKVLSEKYPNEVFYIIKCAFGATSMHSSWRAPSSGVPYQEDLVAQPAQALIDPAAQFPGWCYNACFKLLRDSFRELEEAGLTPCVKAFCWMQGEGDALPEYVKDYTARYDALLSDLKSSFAPYFDECLPIDAGISQVWENYEEMNIKKAAYAEEHGYKFIDTIGAGLTTLNEPYEEPDIYHYDLCSTVKLGELFAEAMVEELGR